MVIRSYAASDRESCLGVFDSNTPRFFGAGERALFETFLERPIGTFLVLCDDAGAVVGCGGIAVKKDGRTAVFAWGMIHAAHQGKGHGRALAMERLGRVAATPGIRILALDTSQETAGFYEKLGFHTLKVIPDHYAPGLHRHDMKLDVDEAFRKRLARRA